MRTHLTRRTISWALAAALLLVAACGDDDSNEAGAGDGAAAAADPADSEYCEVAIEWSIHEMVPFDDTDPEAFRDYWDEWTAFQEDAIATAPEEIKADWELKHEAEAETLTPILEKYDFDVATFMDNATPEEQAATEAPPEVQAAQDRYLTYESEVCGSQAPVPADVSYAAEEPGPYCELVAANDQRAAEVLAAGANPAAVEQLFAGQTDLLAAMDAAAPDAIADDVAALSEWTLGAQKDALDAHAFDVKALLREGSAQERRAFNYADEDIREQYARVAAYEEQVCGA